MNIDLIILGIAVLVVCFFVLYNIVVHISSKRTQSLSYNIKHYYNELQVHFIILERKGDDCIKIESLVDNIIVEERTFVYTLSYHIYNTKNNQYVGQVIFETISDFEAATLLQVCNRNISYKHHYTNAACDLRPKKMSYNDFKLLKMGMAVGTLKSLETRPEFINEILYDTKNRDGDVPAPPAPPETRRICF